MCDILLLIFSVELSPFSLSNTHVLCFSFTFTPRSFISSISKFTASYGSRNWGISEILGEKKEKKKKHLWKKSLIFKKCNMSILISIKGISTFPKSIFISQECENIQILHAWHNIIWTTVEIVANDMKININNGKQIINRQLPKSNSNTFKFIKVFSWIIY